MVTRNMNYTEDLTVFNDNTFELTLSVSTQPVQSKAEGGKITEFELQTIDTKDENELAKVLTGRNYSTNVWTGSCSNDNYVGMTGVTLDFDATITIAEAQETFKDVNFILHTTASHQSKQPLGDRFRVILPFAPGNLRFTTGAECRSVYRKLLATHPQADKACADPAHKYFPHTNELGSEFVLRVNSTGRYFDVDITDATAHDVSDHRRAYVAPEELNTREELDRMLKFDQFIPWCVTNASSGLPEPLWHAMISNLCRFEGGREMIHKISALDPVDGRYDFDGTEDKIAHALESSGPMTYEEIVRRGWPGIVPVAPLSPAGWGKIGHQTKTGYVQIDWTDDIIVRINETWRIVNLASLKECELVRIGKIQAVCPVCDCDTASAQLDEFHFARIWCHRCQKAYYEAPLSPNMFNYKNKLLRVEKRAGRFISVEVLEEPSFRTKEEFKYVEKKLMTDPNRRFLDSDFQIQRIGNGDFAELDYEFRMNDNALVFRYPALPVDVKDNALIDQFLDGMFGSYAGFVKDWLAMYVYTNYVSLPVIVLTGERSCGKNTFAEMVGRIFPSLFGLWDGSKERFNDQYTKKLLFVDENPNSDKPTQYTEIKKITGNELLRIEEKYAPSYYAPNNVKIIIATNDPRPMFLKAREEPKSENTNNFFIYKCPDVASGRIDKTLGDKLEARLGWYVRTELKGRFARLASQATQNNRYALSAPITPLARDLFASAKSTIEMEAEELARHLVFGVNIPNLKNTYAPNIRFQAYTFNGSQYVQFQEIRELVGQLGFKGSPNQPKSYITVLQDQGVLSHDSARCAERHLGYKILRSKDYYTTTVSGVLPVADDGNDVLGGSKPEIHHPHKPSIYSVLDTSDDGNDGNDVPFLNSFMK